MLDDGRSVPLGTPKQQALLAVLLLHANEVVSRERLIDELWGERPPATADKAVQVYVSQLRKTLGQNGAAIATRARGYVLELQPESVDAGRFQRLVAEARERSAAGETEAAARLFRQALALWRGPPLAGLAFESEAETEIERLEQERLSALLERIDCDLAIGRHTDALSELEALVRKHPLQERPRGQLMLALYRSGRQADALRVYREARETLVEELGIEPSAALQHLERAILTHDPALEAPAGMARAEPRTLDEPRAAPFAGREEELAARAGVATARSLYQRRVALAAAGAVALAATLVVAVLIVSRSDKREARPAITLEPNGVAIIDPETNDLVGEIPVGTRTGPIAVGDSSIWVGKRDDQTLIRIDPRTRRVVRTIGLGAAPSAVGVGGGAVWVVSELAGAVFKIDPDLNDVIARIEVGETFVGPGKGVAFGAGSLWVRHGSDITSRIDAATNDVKRIATGPICCLAFGERAIWAVAAPSATPANDILKIDPSRGSTTDVIEAPETGVLEGANGIDVGEGSVWAIKKRDEAVWKIDPDVGRLDAIIRLGHPPIDVAVGEGAVWTANADATVSRIDPKTERVQTIPLGRPPRIAFPVRIVVGEGAVWVTMQ